MGDPHTGFIVAAYVLAAAVIVGVLVMILVDYRTQKRALAELEARTREASGD